MACSSPTSCDAKPAEALPCEKRGTAPAENMLYREGQGHPSPAPIHTLKDTSGPPEGSSQNHTLISFFSWNIGGKPISDALKAVDVAQPHKARDGIMALQELPRVAPGWHTTKEEGGRLLVQYRDDLRQWRGNGIAFNPEKFVSLRRKASPVGVWLRLRHRDTGAEFWVSSARLSTGVPDSTTAEEIQVFLKLRPKVPSQAVLLSDFNTRLTWSAGAGRIAQPSPSCGRADYLVSEIETQHFLMCGPPVQQWDTPTSRPRRAGARGKQIDGAAVRSLPRAETHIEEKSFRQIGGDHDRIHLTIAMARGGGGPPPDQSTRPRIVSREPKPQPYLDQQIMEKLARTHTRPLPGNRYRDPEHVKKLYQKAKKTGCEQDWKEAHKARRTAQDQWHMDKVKRAGQGSWKDFRELKPEQGLTWAVHLSEERNLSPGPLNTSRPSSQHLKMKGRYQSGTNRRPSQNPSAPRNSVKQSRKGGNAKRSDSTSLPMNCYPSSCKKSSPKYPSSSGWRGFGQGHPSRKSGCRP